MIKNVYKVSNIECTSCENRIKNILEFSFEDIIEVKANHNTKEVTIFSNKEIDLEQIKLVLLEQGFYLLEK